MNFLSNILEHRLSPPVIRGGLMKRLSVYLDYPLLLVIILLSLFVFVSNTYASDGEVTNREIMEAIMRLEGEIKVLGSEIKRVDQRIDATNKRIDDMNDDMNNRFDDVSNRFSDQFGYMLGGFGIVFSAIVILFGFILRERRITLGTEVKKINEVIIRSAEKLPPLKQALKEVGVL